jgi:hypothetical protein
MRTLGRLLLAATLWVGLSAGAVAQYISTPPGIIPVTAFTYYPTNLALQVAIGGSASTVYRGGFFAAGDGGASFYQWSTSACSLNSGSGDNGSQVAPATGVGCWIAEKPTGPWDVRIFGADATGANDSTVALNACLAAAGPGGTCLASGGTTLKILGAVSLPGHTTLSCGNSYLDAEDNPAAYASTPAIKVSNSPAITATGEGAAVANCLIYRNGMTFPAADSSGFAGTGLSDAGYGNFTVIGSVIIGFDTAIDTSGPRPYIQYVYVDGTGVTHPVIYEHNGNSDGGVFDNIKIQPLATGNYGGSITCAEATRPGTGFYMGGINFIGKIVSQNMRTAEFDFEFYTIADGIWADFPVACLSAPSSYTPTGVLIGNTQLMANHVDINSVSVGIISKNTGAANWIGSLFLNSVGGDCVQIGTSGGVAGGAFTIGDVVMNAGNASNCGGYVVNYLDSTHLSYLTINSGLLHGANSGNPPYINVPSAVNAWQINISPKVVTDLANPAAIYGATTVGSCTGLGTSGNACALMPSSLTDPYSGVVLLTVGSGGSPGTTGVAELTWPLTISNVNGCTAGIQDAGNAWAVPAGVKIISIDSTHTELSWFANSALTASGTYRIAFTCRPQ